MPLYAGKHAICAFLRNMQNTLRSHVRYKPVSLIWVSNISNGVKPWLVSTPLAGNSPHALAAGRSKLTNNGGDKWPDAIPATPEGKICYIPRNVPYEKWPRSPEQCIYTQADRHSRQLMAVVLLLPCALCIWTDRHRWLWQPWPTAPTSRASMQPQLLGAFSELLAPPQHCPVHQPSSL